MSMFWWVLRKTIGITYVDDHDVDDGCFRFVFWKVFGKRVDLFRARLHYVHPNVDWEPNPPMLCEGDPCVRSKLVLDVPWGPAFTLVPEAATGLYAVSEGPAQWLCDSCRELWWSGYAHPVFKHVQRRLA